MIGQASGDLSAVLNAIARTAARLCEAGDALIFLVEGDQLRLVAKYGRLRVMFGETSPISRGTISGRATLDRRTLHVRDVRTAARTRFPEIRARVQAESVRTVLATPLLRDGVAVGVVLIRRTTLRPFTPKQIALLKTFADQAVIAIENVRLFQELQARTRDLTRSVEELKALGEVSQAVSSTLDLQTVLTTIVSRAVQLSGASGGVIYEYDEATQEFHLRASHRMEEELVEALRAAPIRLGEGATGQAAVRRAPVQVADIGDERQYGVTRIRAVLTRLGYRSVLAVPLLLEQRTVGALTVWRQEVGSFSTEVVNLLQTFAGQSVLAIQNARLFREIEDKSRQLEVVGRHKSEFLANLTPEDHQRVNGYVEQILQKGAHNRDSLLAEVREMVATCVARRRGAR